MRENQLEQTIIAAIEFLTRVTDQAKQLIQLKKPISVYFPLKNTFQIPVTVHSFSGDMKIPAILLLLITLILNPIVSVADSAYPPPCGIETPTSCQSTASDDLITVRREVYGNGRIFDITHPLTPNIPCWGSEEGLGQFLWLSKSMKNGSVANNSEMKLPAHTGTHIDAPGDVYDHYFDAGFDVDTLDFPSLFVSNASD